MVSFISGIVRKSVTNHADRSGITKTSGMASQEPLRNHDRQS